jgi:hypothetical protein
LPADFSAFSGERGRALKGIKCKVGEVLCKLEETAIGLLRYLYNNNKLKD